MTITRSRCCTRRPEVFGPGAGDDAAIPLTAALRGLGLVRSYGEGDTAVHALRGVSLEVAPERLTAVMGPSGSGKSTLMHVLAAHSSPRQRRGVDRGAGDHCAG